MLPKECWSLEEAFGFQIWLNGVSPLLIRINFDSSSTTRSDAFRTYFSAYRRLPREHITNKEEKNFQKILKKLKSWEKTFLFPGILPWNAYFLKSLSETADVGQVSFRGWGHVTLVCFARSNGGWRIVPRAPRGFFSGLHPLIYRRTTASDSHGGYREPIFRKPAPNPKDVAIFIGRI